MKTLKTSSLFWFAAVAICLTIAFRFFLSYGIDNKIALLVNLNAIVYGLLMFGAGWYFGKKEAEYLPVSDIGFRFHLATYIIYNLISQTWFVAGFNSVYEKQSLVHMTMIIWGGFLLLHFIVFLLTRKNTIKGLHKNDIFE